MFTKLAFVAWSMLFLASPALANGNCQAGLGRFVGGKVAFSLWMAAPGQNAVFVSGVTEINKPTNHDQHFSDRTDGISDRMQITIDSYRSQLTTYNVRWNDRRTVDLNCDSSSGVVTGLTGDGGVRLALARWKNPPVEISLADNKLDAIDAIPQQGGSPSELATQALNIIRKLTQSDPNWVARMNAIESQRNLSGMNLLAYRLGAIRLLTQ